MKRILTVFVCVCMTLFVSSSALAANPGEVFHKANGTIPTAESKGVYKVIDAPDILIATFPAEIPIIVDTRGEVTVPDNLKIANECDRNLKVTKLTFSKLLQMTSYERVYNDPVSCCNYFGLKINGMDMDSAVLTSNREVDWSIPVGEEYPINVEAVFGVNLRNEVNEYTDCFNLSYTITFAD